MFLRIHGTRMVSPRTWFCWLMNKDVQTTTTSHKKKYENENNKTSVSDVMPIIELMLMKSRKPKKNKVKYILEYQNHHKNKYVQSKMDH